MTVERFDRLPRTRNRHRIIGAASQRLTRVAVADDEPNMRAVIASILSEDGYAVRTAKDGLELLDLVASFDPDVVLTDVSMPHVSGLEVLRALQARGSRARIVLMTARRSWESDSEISGATAVLDKPFDIDTLLEALKRS